MPDDLNDRLRSLTVEELADALVELSERDRETKRFVERLVETREEGVKRFKARLAGLKRSKTFVPRSRAPEVARQLAADIEGLCRFDIPPRIGLELMTATYGVARSIFHRCDDSFGSIGDVYRYDVANAFIDFAIRCEDPDSVLDIVGRLLREDEWSLCSPLVNRVTDYLSPDSARELRSRLLKEEATPTTAWVAENYAATISAQLNEPEMFLELRQRQGRGLSATDQCELARMYADLGDFETARRWIEQVSRTNEPHGAHELRQRIYAALGDTSSQQEIAWERFRKERSAESLEELLQVVGEEARPSIVDGEVVAILAKPEFRTNDLRFLLGIGQRDAADQYVRERAERVDGLDYVALLALAPHLPPVSSSVIHRALIDSILDRGSYKNYPIAVRYMKRLEQLAAEVDDWAGTPDHAKYVEQLRERHGKKSGFWGKL